MCIVTQSSYPEDVRIRKEVKALIGQGHRILVLSLHRPGREKHEVAGGVEIFRGGMSKSRSGALRYLMEYAAFFLFTLFKLNILDAREKIDVVQVCNLPDILVFAAIIQKLKKRRIIVDMHEIMPEFFMSKFGVCRESFIVKMLVFVERISLLFADEVMTVNEPIKKIFEKRAIPGRSIEVVMNTMDESTGGRVGKKDHCGFNCVYHGTITELYGLDMALLGFSKAFEHAGDMLFHIFGEGPELRKLRWLARDLGVERNVVFHGHVPYQEMMQRLGEMDLGILALRKDVFLNLSFSNKLAEYIFLKIPVVTSDLDSVKYYFGEDQILYYESGNAEDLSRKILYAYLNREKIGAMSEAALDRYREIDWSVMEKRYLRVIDGERGFGL